MRPRDSIVERLSHKIVQNKGVAGAVGDPAHAKWISYWDRDSRHR
jgi:hypothetical protein